MYSNKKITVHRMWGELIGQITIFKFSMWMERLKSPFCIESDFNHSLYMILSLQLVIILRFKMIAMITILVLTKPVMQVLLMQYFICVFWAKKRIYKFWKTPRKTFREKNEKKIFHKIIRENRWTPAVIKF